ncbi:MAG TPA: LAGLIDADG family homing endonuclease [Candidatus Nanoarchaeia archaeon]|nr:LAGLIDADG family homing endonuclease [Candidatus Nanoarchaeia archaeon]
MDFSTRNKKVAQARWQKALACEVALIPTDHKAILVRASLCGFLAGDGSVSVRLEKKYLRYDLRFFPDDAKMLAEYTDALFYLYRKRPHVTKEGKLHNVVITSRTIVEDILKVAQFGIKTWTLPISLFSVPGAKEMWLRAFFSAEGYVGKNAIKVQTVNELGMQAVSSLLRKVGIAHGCYIYHPKKPNHSTVYIIMISNLIGRKNFLDKIGFAHERKELTLRKTLGL